MEDPELTPAQEEAVRRRLAGARHDQPVPADVAARMDEVLADLAAERAGSTASDEAEQVATVTALPRRRWPQVLLAAAAVAAIGVGVTQVLPTDSGDDSTSADSSGEIDREALSEAPAADREREKAGAAPTVPPGTESRSYSKELDELTDKYLPQLSQLPDVAAKQDAPGELRVRRAAGCGPATLAAGATAIPVRYREQDALAVFGPEDTPQQVAIYVCEGDQPRTPVVTLQIPPGE